MEVFINDVAAFMPNAPVDNDHIEDVVGTMGDLRGLDGDVASGRADQLFVALQLIDDADRPISGFSKGMRQKVVDVIYSVIREDLEGVAKIWYAIGRPEGRIDYPAMFAGIIAMALLGVVLYEALDVVEAWSTRWRKSAR